jgi:hypothetical protein
MSDDILRPEDRSVHRGHWSIHVNPRQTLRVLPETVYKTKVLLFIAAAVQNFNFHCFTAYNTPEFL